MEQRVIQPELVEAAVIKQKQVSEKKAAEARLIRIQADKLDCLIDLVGELVIAGASANLLASRSGLGELTEATSLLSRLVEQIRDSALQLRMVQIGETFNRFQRVVRDVSKELGKEIELVISGADTRALVADHVDGRRVLQVDARSQALVGVHQCRQFPIRIDYKWQVHFFFGGKLLRIAS